MQRRKWCWRHWRPIILQLMWYNWKWPHRVKFGGGTNQSHLNFLEGKLISPKPRRGVVSSSLLLISVAGQREPNLGCEFRSKFDQETSSERPFTSNTWGLKGQPYCVIGERPCRKRHHLKVKSTKMNSRWYNGELLEERTLSWSKTRSRFTWKLHLQSKIRKFELGGAPCSLTWQLK